MLIVRPATNDDMGGLVDLAAGSTAGVHTLGKSPAAVQRAIDHSMRSFASQCDIPGDESYLFVLEDAGNQRLIGSAAMAATAGSSGTFFSFRNDVIQQVSRDLQISHSVHALTLCADLTSYSQLMSFFVRRDHLASPAAALLSRARLLYAASLPQRFNQNFFVSLAGYTDQLGRSPFWEALGRKFFQMDFLEAERLVEGARNRNLIVELMPHYPVYVPLLSGAAQAALGQVHTESEVPFDMLSAEGFAADDFIDIFDGGPILQANRYALRSFARGRQLSVALESARAQRSSSEHSLAQDYLISMQRDDDFRAAMVRCAPPEPGGPLHLPSAILQALHLDVGDAVYCVAA